MLRYISCEFNNQILVLYILSEIDIFYLIISLTFVSAKKKPQTQVYASNYGIVRVMWTMLAFKFIGPSNLQIYFKVSEMLEGCDGGVD